MVDFAPCTGVGLQMLAGCQPSDLLLFYLLSALFAPFI
jgi:hypothetical protein